MLQFLATSSPFFAVIAVGVWAARRGLFAPESVKVLNTFAFMIATPAMVVRVMARQPIAELWNPAYIGGLAMVALALLTLGLLAARRVARLPFPDSVSRAQCLIGGNFAFLGIPLTVAFLGERAAAPVAMGLICDTALVVPLCIGLIEAGRGVGAPGAIAWRLAKGTVLNPFMLSIMAGAALSLAGVALPEPADRFLAFLGGAAAPAGVFALGLALAQWVRPDLWRVVPLALAKLTLHPLAVFLALRTLGLDPFWVKAGVLYAAVPVAANAFVIAERYGTGDRPVAGAILVSTVLATLTFPLAAWLVSG
ncbi:permease [Alsobacter metallidurans]|uniref:Permease n=1 Tax=Alsobacter metallidurans TaxID=340221 RepID=A0A917I5R0_9HYPH|nr:AEC family transporter [Alsobacter metallidurans]GGH17413.1 permease [Alsobacter metallidurans]